jgi:TatD DNase family protein
MDVMDFIDTHSHLDAPAFHEDRDAVIAASRASGVNRWINVGYDEERWESTLDLVASVPGMSCMLGLHPGSVDAWSPELLARLRELAVANAPVAIGEIGIDLHWRQDNLPTQVEAFNAQLDLAEELGLPAVIHMRAADAETLDVLTGRDTLPQIHFHSFDGDDHLRAWVLAHGATIGVGGLVTRKGSEGLRNWVASIPRDRVVLETDAPYLKPRGIRGMRNEPAYMVRSAKLLAGLWGEPIDRVAHITTANAERIFGLGEESGS